MSRSSRPLPLVLPLPSLVAAVVLLVLGALGTGLGFLSLLLLGAKKDEAPVPLVLGLILGLTGLRLILRRATLRRHRWRWVREARHLGLEEFSLYVVETDLEPFQHLPLFRFGHPDRDKADSLLSGRIDGLDVRVMHYRYSGKFLTDKGRQTLRGNQQTIALFPNAGKLADFHLGPEETPWDVLAPDWERDLGVGPIVQTVKGKGRERTLIRSKDADAVNALFTPQRLQDLGKLSGWTIESRSGDLLIYRHRETIETTDLALFVKKTTGFVRALAGEAERRQSERSRPQDNTRSGASEGRSSFTDELD